MHSKERQIGHVCCCLPVPHLRGDVRDVPQHGLRLAGDLLRHLRLGVGRGHVNVVPQDVTSVVDVDDLLPQSRTLQYDKP